MFGNGQAVSVKCREIEDDIILDLGPEDEICGIEILGASKKLFENSKEPELTVENIKIAT